MENTSLETRIFNLESMTEKLAQANGLTNEVVTNLITGITPLVSQCVTQQVGNQIKEEVTTKTKEVESNVLKTVDGKIEETVKTAVNERGLNRTEMKRLTNARNLRFRQLLGDSKTDKYIILISFYQGAMVKEYRKKFDCCAYGDVEATRLDEALSYIKNFDVSQGYYNWAIEKLHEQYRDGEIENRKKLNAYERFFGIKVA